MAIGLLLACSTEWQKRNIAGTTHRHCWKNASGSGRNAGSKAESEVKRLQTNKPLRSAKLKLPGQYAVNGQATDGDLAEEIPPSPNLLLSGYGDLKIYGDVEFNMDAESNHGLLAMTNADVNSDPTNEQWNLNGRILLGF
ncbi:carbohydrate porin [Escherichia coli]|nr:carbohydrate porin [Escherichia coli]